MVGVWLPDGFGALPGVVRVGNRVFRLAWTHTQAKTGILLLHLQSDSKWLSLVDTSSCHFSLPAFLTSVGRCELKNVWSSMSKMSYCMNALKQAVTAFVQRVQRSALSTTANHLQRKKAVHGCANNINNFPSPLTYAPLRARFYTLFFTLSLLAFLPPP